MNETNTLTHFSEAGRARMVDVSEKPSTPRTAIASGILRMQAATLERIRAGQMKKGDVLTVADVGAVMAAKRTPELIPMCHSLALSGVDVDFSEITEADAQGCVGIKVLVAGGTAESVSREESPNPRTDPRVLAEKRNGAGPETCAAMRTALPLNSRY